LLEHAQYQIPPSLHVETPLFLLATAGMRLLTQDQQVRVLRETCTFLKFHSHFRIDDPSDVGPCGSSVRIITGEEEGLFGWIAVNYLMDGFTAFDKDKTTYGFLDMGGASTQIAFEPSAAERARTNTTIPVRLRLLSGKDIHHEVFVTTWLGYGTNQARERYVAKAIDEYEEARPAGSRHGSSTEGELIADPCLPKNLQLTETPMHTRPTDAHADTPHTLVGTGSFEQCLQKALPLLNKEAPCPDSPCLFNGVHVPPIDFAVSHFIGVSEYWYSSEHVFNLGGAYDFVQYERAASDFCAHDWTTIVREHEAQRARGKGRNGDGEEEKDGQIIQMGKWDESVSLSRLQMQCFKAAWVANVLHDGIGMPRIVDAGGNITSGGDHKDVEKHAQNKGLGRPMFQSVDKVGDVAISWTLGKMVLEASKEVPPLLHNDRPLADPLEDLPDPAHSPIRPIRPFLDFDAIEDSISDHLPTALTRQSLGFSFVGFLFYVMMICVAFILVLRSKHRIRRVIRNFRRQGDYYRETYGLEEGRGLNGSPTTSRPVSPPAKSSARALWLRLYHVIFPSQRRPRLTLGVPQNASSARMSPIRSQSVPLMHRGLGPTGASSQLQPPSRPLTPSSPSMFDSDRNTIGSFATSRSSSQISLSTLAPTRAGARSGNGALTPTR
jgi:golgi apyrase